MHKISQKREETEEKHSIAEQIRAMPMSKLSKERFSIENVREIMGELILFNDGSFSKHFPIRKEDMTKLAVFAYRAESETGSKSNPEGVALQLLRLPEHGRNLSFNIKFSDNRGNLYNYIDIKGVGLPKNARLLDASNSRLLFDVDILPETETIEKAHPGMWGLSDYESAIKDWEESNELIKKGNVETAVPIAIIKIREIFLKNGEKKSIEDLKNEGRIPRRITYGDEKYEYTPVVYLRAFKEVMRVSNAEKEDFEKFAKEHGMSNGEYVDWWIGRIAKNLAKMHNQGKVHKNLIFHNLTLDGCFVDFDTVKDYNIKNIKMAMWPEHIGPDWIVMNDIEKILVAVDYLSNTLGSDSATYRHKKRMLFFENYFENFTNITKDVFEAMCYYLNHPYSEL